MFANRCATNRHSRSSGFTLLEMLVAIAIGAIVMVGAVRMMQSNRTAFLLVDQLKTIEENARAGIDIFAKEARQAGMGAGAGVAIIPLYDGDAFLTAANAKPGSDGAELFVTILSQPICVPISPNGNPGDPTLSAAGTSISAYTASFEGMQDFSGGNLASTLTSYSAFIYALECPSTNWCAVPIGGAADDGTTVSLTLDNSANNEGRAHPCTDVVAACAGGGAPTTACLNIGSDIYYYVRASTDPSEDNPQLKRYANRAGHETVANYVEEMTIQVLDAKNASWQVVTEANAADISALHIHLKVKHPKKDMKFTGEPDNRRSRYLTRTANIRNR